MANQGKKISAVLHLSFTLVRDLLTCTEVDGDAALFTGHSAKMLLESAPSFVGLIHPDDKDISDIIFSHQVQSTQQTLALRIVNKAGQIKIFRATYQKHTRPEQITDISVVLKSPSGMGDDVVKAYALNNYITMLENTDDFIYFKNRDHVFTGASQTIVDISTGQQLWTDLVGKVDYDIFPRAFADIYYTLEKKILSGATPMAQETHPIEDRNGKPGWIDNRKYAMTDKAGNVIGLFGIARDITELVETEKKLRKSEERVRLALLAAQQAWFDLDVKTGEVEVSEEYPAMLGFEVDEFRSSIQEWKDNLHPEDRGNVQTALQNCIVNGGPTAMEYRRRTKSGDWLWLGAVGKVIEWDAEHRATRLIGIHTNIHQRKLMELELKQKAYTDYLTEVNNRGYFMELGERELSRALRYQAPLAILMLDIDFFKKINDSHGHKLGDMVLKKLADICKNTLREIDIVGRIGGEEFAILLPETDQLKAAEVAERLRIAIADTKIPMKDGLPIQFTVSIGVACVLTDDDNMDVLLNRADQALYQAKKTGRNRVCITPAP
jgi:diguanylate cyclase (GGDEF)-like protein/PAS domain S-box-containing protein